MTKVYPNTASPIPCPPPPPPCVDHYNYKAAPNHDDHDLNNSNPNPIVLTVWKKSLVFNCDGFTVFDARGNLVYRVDNYNNNNNNKANEIFLMDASGNSLLTLRRRKKLMSLIGDSSWLVFDGESTDNPRFFVVRKNARLLSTKSNKCQLEMISTNKNDDDDNGNGNGNYEIEGCYAKRCCDVYVYDGKRRRRVAEIKPKETFVKGVAFGNDVFRLLVQPDFDSSLAMAVVILLDRIFGST